MEDSLLNDLIAAKTEVERLKAEINSNVYQERLEQEKAFNKAFAKAQAEFKALSKSMSAEFTTKTGHLIAYSYAPMSAIKDAVMPALNRNGLAISHYEKSANGLVSVVTVITHEGGYSREWQSPAMVYDAKDARSMRRVVSSLRRYGTLNACGIEESSSDDEHLEYVAEQAEVSQMETGQMYLSIGMQKTKNRKKIPTQLKRYLILFKICWIITSMILERLYLLNGC